MRLGSPRDLGIWGWWSVANAISLGGLVLIAATLKADVPSAFAFRGFPAPLVIAATTVGALIASRLPRHPLGWLLLAAGTIAALVLTTTEYASVSLLLPGSLPGAAVAAWLSSWIWVGAITLVGVYVPLLFPDGRLYTPAWRSVAALAAATAVVLAASYAFRSGELYGVPGFENPFALAIAPDRVELPRVVGTAVLVALMAASAFSLALRFRSTTGATRQQIKWLVYAAVLFAVGFLVGNAFSVAALQALAVAGVVSIPVSVGIAILRYRLYDIDVLINRTLVYGGLSALLLGTYIAAVVVGQALLRPLTRGSELAVAASTLASLALAQPLRRRLQSAVDRRFYRRKYDAERTIARFSARLRAEVDLDTLQGELGAVVRETMQPAHLSLWLREGRG